MTDFFSVTNFDRLQHYKDRGPTWIKLYNRLLDDYGFAHLPDAAKWHLIGIQLLASRLDNRIPSDPKWLARQIGACVAIDLGLLERKGFIAPAPDVDSGLQNSGNPASTEKRREETETETENILSAGADPSRIIESDSGRKTYPEDFEAFWNGYPTDPLMSKSKAFDEWRRMIRADRAAAMNSLSAFREFVRRQVNYRAVHAWKYLTERRYDGFAQAVIDPEVVAAARDKADRLLKRGKYAEKYR